MSYNEDDISFPAYSALFNYVDESIFIRNKISNKVQTILNDTNDLNLKINNEKRLKSILFNEIKDKYNSRINDYELNYPRISKEDFENFQVNKFKLKVTKAENSGYYTTFPKTFYCDKCGDFRVFGKNDKWEKFNIEKCKRTGCDGHYKQLGIVSFCEQCGKIDSIFKNCPKHGTEFLKLNRKSKENISSWSVTCTKCDFESDFLSYPCNHKNNYQNYSICDKPATKLKPLNVIQGVVSKSVVITTVDVPHESKLDNLDEIMFGLYLNKFDYITKYGFDITLKNIISKLEAREKLYSDPDLKKMMKDSLKPLDKIYETVKEIKENYKEYSLTELNDYLMLTDFFSEDETNIMTYSKFVKNDEKHEKIFKTLQKNFGIEEITYISDIHLISSSIGSIKGINKFYEKKFAPHFEPHWKNKAEREIFKAYSYPFETEGIMFDLNKIKIVNWLINNNFLNNETVETEEEAKKILIEMEEGSEEYDKLTTLLHTFSHILIRRSSLYTGLDTDSCSEILFPKTGAFLIYSTSNINIGGFNFVFENSLLNWFNDIHLDMNDCTFDPMCLHDNGSCFSCLYLPEFVCCLFNSRLDRDAFLGKTNRYKKGFWKRS